MKRLLIIMLVFSVAACKKSGAKKDEPVLSPTKAVLTAPAANSVCLEGQVISNSTSAITFSWNKADHADSYELIIKNLLTGTTETKATSSTQLTVNLDRNTPFSWYVISKSAAVTQTSQSDTWKFYNAGAGSVSYAPFPADNLNPGKGQLVNAVNGKTVFTWTGEDADNDIKDYEVLLGLDANSLAVIKSNLATPSLNDVSVVSGATYYWKVITKDAKGNTSSSEIQHFKVN